MNDEQPIDKMQHIAQNCASFHIRSASRLISQVFDQHLAPTGLRGTQFSLLNALGIMDNPTVKDIAKVLTTDRTTLTRNLKPLLRDGLVVTVSGEDKRERRLALTQTGEQRLAQAMPLWEKAQEEVKGWLEPGAWPDMKAMLTTMIQTGNQQLNT